MEFALKVRFETIDDDLVKAYVNDVYIGRVKYGAHYVKRQSWDEPDPRFPDNDHIWKPCVVFRCSKNPFSSYVRRPEYQTTDNERPLAETLENTDVRNQLIPIVIRNALRNYGSALFPVVAPTQEETFAKLQALAGAPSDPNAPVKLDA